MKPWLPLLISIFSFMALPGNSQDAHWSLFEYAPLNTNPALTGAFYGTYRLSGIVRDQEFFGDVTQGVTNVYGPTMTFSVDGPLIRGFRKQDWLGVGGMFYQDKAGDGALITNFSLLSIAYHLALDKKQKTVLTFGLQGGSTTRRFKRALDLRFEDGSWDPTAGVGVSEEMLTYAEMIPAGKDGKGNSELKRRQGSPAVDVNFGLLLKSKASKKVDFEIGIVGKHLIPNRFGFQGEEFDPLDTMSTNRGRANKLPINIGMHSGLTYQINNKWSVRPALQFQTISGSGPYFQFGGMFGYKFDPKKDFILKFGPGYRIGDAAQLFLGMEKGPFRAALSYGFNLSDLQSVTVAGGGAEIAVSYIGTIFKQPDLTPVILCPRY